MHLFFDRIRDNREYGGIIRLLKERGKQANPHPALVTGLCEGAIDVFLASCISDKELAHHTALICVPDEKMATRLLCSMKAFGLRTAIYPDRDPVLYNIISSHELEHERIAVLTDITEKKLDAVIATPTAALSYTISENMLRAATKTLAVGDVIGMDELASFLASSGYVRSDLVDGKGKFSIRGGIVDIFPPHLHAPVRMELFGDEIDQIGYFDLMSQRKTENIKSVRITCAREILISEEKRKGLAALIFSAAGKARSEEVRSSLMHEYESLTNGLEISFADKYISYIYPEKTTLLDYLAKDTLTFAIETNGIADRIQKEVTHMTQTTGDLIEQGVLLPKYCHFLADSAALYSFLDAHSALLINQFVTQYQSALSGIFSFNVNAAPSVTSDFEILSADIRDYIRNQYAVLLLCENDVEGASMRDLLIEHEMPAVLLTDIHTGLIPGMIMITAFDLKGFSMTAERFVCISLSNSSNKVEKALLRRDAKTKKAAASKEKLLSYADLEVGDYVVHDTNGIGIYLGIESVRTYEGIRRDHIKIQYAGKDMLYIPCENIDSISKYIGSAAEKVRSVFPDSAERNGKKQKLRSRMKSEIWQKN